jgi:LCP family protein required for cell wall assembly
MVPVSVGGGRDVGSLRRGCDVMGRRIRWGRLLALVLGIGILAGAAYAYHFYKSAGAALASGIPADKNQGPYKGRITILLLGEGLVQNGNTDITNPNVPDQSDSMMLLSVDPTTDQASVLSIPRDTMINLPAAGGLAKINDANFIGGPKLAAKVVEETIGVPVDYYVETTMYNFAKVVNLLGGLDVYVPFPMHYGTATGKFAYLNINLNPGLHHLNGYQVLQFVRYRNEPLGDIGRIQQQQYIIKLILKKVLSPGEITKLPTVISLLRQDITHTNLTDTQMVELAALATHIHLDQIRYATLPGLPETVNGVSYWSLDRNLLPVVEDDILLDRLTRADRGAIHIEVATGTDSIKPAETLYQWLVHEGFSVSPPVWSSQHNLQETVITNYTGDKYLAAQLADAVGGTGTAVVDNIPYHDVPGVDVVIVVGSDFHLNPRVTP